MTEHVLFSVALIIAISICLAFDLSIWLIACVVLFMTIVFYVIISRRGKR